MSLHCYTTLLYFLVFPKSEGSKELTSGTAQTYPLPTNETVSSRGKIDFSKIVYLVYLFQFNWAKAEVRISYKLKPS